jgi:hypothetical protein
LVSKYALPDELKPLYGSDPTSGMILLRCKSWVIAVAIAASGAPPFALSHKHATGVVKERMDLMEEIGKHAPAAIAMKRIG